jgi:hypothetical protein
MVIFSPSGKMPTPENLVLKQAKSQYAILKEDLVDVHKRE